VVHRCTLCQEPIALVAEEDGRGRSLNGDLAPVAGWGHEGSCGPTGCGNRDRRMRWGFGVFRHADDHSAAHHNESEPFLNDLRWDSALHGESVQGGGSILAGHLATTARSAVA
jgi:hypothetical protein